MKSLVIYYLEIKGLSSLYNDLDYKSYKRKLEKNGAGNLHNTALNIVDMMIKNSPPVCCIDC